MNFGSLKEYFYKLYNRCFLFVLLPLAVFIYVYFQLQARIFFPPIQDEIIIQTGVLVLFVIAMIYLTTVHWLTRKRLKKYALEKGLGIKLDKYGDVIFMRFAA
jgi:hypothetical protein